MSTRDLTRTQWLPCRGALRQFLCQVMLDSYTGDGVAVANPLYARASQGYINTWENRMYYQVISQCTQSLKNLEAFLDKAEQYAAAKKFDVNVLMTTRLAPDMQPLIYQVQSACDYLKAGAARLSGQTIPKHEDNEKTIGEVRARIRKTVAFAESVKEEEYEEASNRKLNLSWAPGKVIAGEDYLLQITIPNIYFHIAMAYAIFRNNGIDVGKMDFLGSLDLVDA